MSLVLANKILREAVVEMSESQKSRKKEVSTAFYKYFDRVQIDMMDIGKVYKAIEEILASGKNMDGAMKALVKKYKK